MLSVGVISGPLRTTFELTALELSFLASSYLYIYILLQTPAGIMLDSYGAKKLLTGGAVVSALGCWMFAHSQDLASGMLGRSLMGGGCSFVFVASVQLANRWFPERYFGMMVGFAETAGMVGAIVSNMLLAMFLEQLGWRDCFSFAAVFSVILALLCWLIISDYPKSVIPRAKQKLTWTRIKLNFQYIATEPQVWLNSIYVCFMYVAVTVFAGLWANPFLRRVYDLSLGEATFASCLVLAGLGIGSPIVGVIFDTTAKRCILMKYSPIVMLSLMVIILYVYIPWYSLICVLMFLLGVSGSSLIQAFAIVSEIAPDGVKSTSVGFSNTIALITGAVGSPVIGWVLNILSDDARPDGLEFYSVANYRIALSVLPAFMIISFFIGKMIAADLLLTEHTPVEEYVEDDEEVAE